MAIAPSPLKFDAAPSQGMEVLVRREGMSFPPENLDTLNPDQNPYGAYEPVIYTFAERVKAWLRRSALNMSDDLPMLVWMADAWMREQHQAALPLMWDYDPGSRTKLRVCVTRGVAADEIDRWFESLTTSCGCQVDDPRNKVIADVRVAVDRLTPAFNRFEASVESLTRSSPSTITVASKDPVGQGMRADTDTVSMGVGLVPQTQVVSTQTSDEIVEMLSEHAELSKVEPETSSIFMEESLPAGITRAMYSTARHAIAVFLQTVPNAADEDVVSLRMDSFILSLKELPVETFASVVNTLYERFMEKLKINKNVEQDANIYGLHLPSEVQEVRKTLTLSLRRAIGRHHQDADVAKNLQEVVANALFAPVKAVKISVLKMPDLDVMLSQRGTSVAGISPSDGKVSASPQETSWLAFKACAGPIREFADQECCKVLTDNVPLHVPDGDIAAWQDAMNATFPWMSGLTARLVRRLHIQAIHRLPLRLPNLALLGPSGVGKTLYWNEAMRRLEHPWTLQGMAGVNDSVSIKGTPAGWGTAIPGLAVMTMASLKCGNPVIVLDEIDKVAQTRHNGHAQDALLPLLDLTTAARYRDDCLQAMVDTSNISWVMTLNDDEALSPELRNRVEIVEVNGPDWTNAVHLNAALTMGEAQAWKAWPASLRTPDTALSSDQKNQLRRHRWKSLRSLGQAIQAMIEENVYHDSIETALRPNAL